MSARLVGGARVSGRVSIRFADFDCEADEDPSGPSGRPDITVDVLECLGGNELEVGQTVTGHILVTPTGPGLIEAIFRVLAKETPGYRVARASGETFLCMRGVATERRRAWRAAFSDGRHTSLKRSRLHRAVPPGALASGLQSPVCVPIVSSRTVHPGPSGARKRVALGRRAWPVWKRVGKSRLIRIE
jgi:hypothetical protein